MLCMTLSLFGNSRLGVASRASSMTFPTREACGLRMLTPVLGQLEERGAWFSPEQGCQAGLEAVYVEPGCAGHSWRQ